MMSSFLRRLLPVARSVGQLWTIPSRGIADVPIRRGPFWDMGWPYPYMRPWSDIWDEQQREYLRRMDRLLRIPPWNRVEGHKQQAQAEGTGPVVREYGPESDVPKITMDKENLLMEMEFNVQHYEADDLFVNLTGDWVIINGQHSIRADKFGYVTRQFTRQIHLPDGLDRDSVNGRYTEKGNLLLSIKARDEESYTRVEELYSKKHQKDHHDKEHQH